MPLIKETITRIVYIPNNLFRPYQVTPAPAIGKIDFFNFKDGREGKKSPETDSITSQISSKTSSRKNDSTKRRNQRHHQRAAEKCLRCLTTIELQWLEHLWSHEKVFEIGVVRANEC